MMRITATFFLCLSLYGCLAQIYQVDTEQSLLQWTGSSAIGGYELSGTLQIQEGQVALSSDSILSGNIVVHMGLLTADNKQLQEHLRSEDFFDVVNFPHSHFDLRQPIRRTKVEAEKEVVGNLTIKSESQLVSLATQIAEVASQVTLSGQLTIDRTKFGITYNSPSFFDNLKDQAIADDFELKFKLIFKAI